MEGDATASFGYWLRRQRRALDLTQVELSQRVGCAVVTLRKIEADRLRPSRDLAERLADCLAIPPDERPAFLRVARGDLSPVRLSLPAQPLSVPSTLPEPAGELVQTYLTDETEHPATPVLQEVEVTSFDTPQGMAPAAEATPVRRETKAAWSRRWAPIVGFAAAAVMVIAGSYLNWGAILGKQPRPDERPALPSVATLTYHPISIEPIMNSYWRDNNGLVELRSGRRVKLGGVEFDLPDEQKYFASESSYDGQYGRPRIAKLQVEVAQPRTVHFLMALGIGLESFAGKQVGRIILNFDNQPSFEMPLVAGHNIRDWCLSNNHAIRTFADPMVRPGYRHECCPNDPTLSSSNECSITEVDILSIDLDKSYQGTTLNEIVIEDLSRDTVGSLDPQLLLFGISVLAR